MMTTRAIPIATLISSVKHYLPGGRFGVLGNPTCARLPGVAVYVKILDEGGLLQPRPCVEASEDHMQSLSLGFL
jgi:hypothetical protein